MDSKLLHDKGNRIQVGGANDKAVYPSLEIIYYAMLETKVKMDSINWAEACKYIVIA